MMKKVTVLICFLVLLGYSAYGDQAAWQGKEESQIRQAQGGEIFPQGKPRFGPPEEAYKACEGKAAGSASQFTGPDGETVKGTCGMDGERLVLRPDRPRGIHRTNVAARLLRPTQPAKAGAQEARRSS